MNAEMLRYEARKIAANNWYSGVKDAVMAGHYDDRGDVVGIVELAILRGIEIAQDAAS